MSKSKVSIVTVLFAVMLAALDFCLWRINKVGFVILTGTLALYGYYEAARTFSAWLAVKPEEPLEPVLTCEQDLLPEDFSATVEEIMQEVQREAAG